jgi:hypothetical protein
MRKEFLQFLVSASLIATSLLLIPPASAAACTQTDTSSGAYTTSVFTSSDGLSCTFNWNLSTAVTAEILIVGGGGGGGGRTYAGGGGAGGVVYFNSINLIASTYALQVGVGGAGGSYSSTCTAGRGSSGAASWFSSSSNSAFGGGGGGGNCNNPGPTVNAIGASGGSGGGGGEGKILDAINGTAGATSTQSNPTGAFAKWGNSGGKFGFQFAAGSGGGGAGSAGLDATSANRGSNGGSGINNYSTLTSGTSVYGSGYIGGGGGGGGKSAGGSGGSGGGGNGGTLTGLVACSNGASYSGSGGGGGSGTAGCAGGSGFILIKYSSNFSIASALTSPASSSVATGYSASSTQTTVTLTRTGSTGSNPTITLSVTGGTWTVVAGSGISVSNTSITSTAPITMTLTASTGSYTLSLNSGSGSASYIASDTSATPLSYTVTVLSQKLDVPENLTAIPASQALKTISVSWQASLNASSYTLKLYSSNEALLVAITSRQNTSRDITTSDYAALQNGTTYKVSIQAIASGSYQNSDISALVTVTTKALQPSEVSLTLITGQPIFLTAKSLSAYTVIAGTVNFKADGKSIPGCTKVPSVGASFTATCLWKPAVRNVVTITATFIPTSDLYFSTTSISQKVSISPRTGSRI